MFYVPLPIQKQRQSFEIKRALRLPVSRASLSLRLFAVQPPGTDPSLLQGFQGLGPEDAKPFEDKRALVGAYVRLLGTSTETKLMIHFWICVF